MENAAMKKALTDESPAGPIASGEAHATRNGVKYVRDEHDTIRSLFASYKGSTDRTVKLSVARDIVKTVVRHASAEERTVYPLIMSVVPAEQGSKHLYDMMVMDDQINKEVLNYLDTHTPQSDSDWQYYDQVVGKFICIEEEHMTKEEKTVLDVLESLTRDEKADLYDKFTAAQKTAPLHPHPTVGGTTTLPAQILHPVAGVIDKAAHAVSGMYNKVMHGTHQHGPDTGKSGTHTTSDQGVLPATAF